MLTTKRPTSPADFLLLVCLLILCSLPIFAADIEVKVEVSASQIALEDTLQLTVSVNTVQEIDAVEPPASLERDFDVLSQGSSSNIQVINGRMTAEKVYQFLLSPKRAGEFVIQSFAVRVAGKNYETNTVMVTVGNASQIPALPVLPADEQGDYFVTAEVSTYSPVVNQQVLYSFRFYTRVELNEARLELPRFAGFFKEELVPENKFYKVIGDSRYVVTEKVFALFPSEPGTVVIDPAVLQLSVPVAGFGGRMFGLRALRDETKVLRTQALSLEVAMEPQPEPEDFSNLVGEAFSLGLSVDKHTLDRNDSATVTVEVRGAGNIADAVLQEWALPESFKRYEDRPQLELQKTPKGLQGIKRFKRVLMPTEPGQYTLPPLTLSYFNPSTKSYETLSTEPVLLTVTGEAAVSAAPHPIPEFPENEPPAPGLSGFTPIDTLEMPAMFVTRFSRWAVFTAVLLPPLAWMAIAAVIAIRRYRQRHSALYRRKYALKIAVRKLKALLKKAPTLVEVEQALRAVRDYFGAVSGRDSGQALSYGEMELLGRGIAHADRHALFAAIGDLEALVYGGAALDPESFAKTIHALMRGLEKSDALL